MPELPEVETVRRSLAPRIVGEVFSGVRVLFEGCVEGVDAGTLESRLRGRRIRELFRRGKYLGFSLEDGACLVIHLRMTGRLIVEEGGEPRLHAHTRLIFCFRSGKALRFDDQRKFGRVMWFKDLTSLEARIDVGVEPLEARFTPERLAAMLEGRRRPIKSFLLDQKYIAGLGNIYADEALFRAGFARPGERRDDSPARKSKTSTPQWGRFWKRG